MADSEQIAKTSQALQAIPAALSRCEEVAQALVDTSQPLCVAQFWWDPRSDYDRARAQVQQQLTELRNQLKRIRRSHLSPDAIRAHALVERLLNQCASCPKKNQETLAAGMQFKCLASQELKQVRFRLDREGNILESR